MSPKDICTVEQIPQLVEAGVDSFKIEGRLKSPQYVAAVTSIYRTYLDQYRQTGTVDVAEEDLRILQQIFNRGGFTRGYLFENPGKALLSGKSPKNQGLYAGKVIAVKKGSSLIDVKLDRKAGVSIQVGDGVEIHGRTITGNVISYRKELPGEILRIGDIKEHVRTGDAVYKVTDKQLMKNLEAGYSGRQQRRLPVSISLHGRTGQKPRLIMQGQGISVSIQGEMLLEKAQQRPADADRIKEQLSKLGDYPFRAEHIHITLEGEPAIAVSVINHLRREAAEALLERKRRQARRKEIPGAVQHIIENEGLDDGVSIEQVQSGDGPVGAGRFLRVFCRETLEKLHADDLARSSTVMFVPLELFMERGTKASQQIAAAQQSGVEIIPYLLNITRGNLDRYIELHFDEIAEAAGKSGILVGNPGWISRFQEAGIKVYGDYGLNVYNRQAMKLYQELGVEVKCLSHEAETDSFHQVPLMVTEHPVAARRLTDRKGQQYTVMQWYSGDKFLIFKKRT